MLASVSRFVGSLFRRSPRALPAPGPSFTSSDDAGSTPSKAAVARAGARLEAATRERYGTYPQRERAGAESTLPRNRSAALYNHSGVLRDSHGRPLYDSSRLMVPTRARGLYADHGQYHEMWRSDAAIFGVFAMVVREMVKHSLRIDDPHPLATPEEREACGLMDAYFGFDGTPGWLYGGIEYLIARLALAKIYGFALCEWHPRQDDAVWWNDRPWVVPQDIKMVAPWSVRDWLWNCDDLVGYTQLVPRSGSYATTRDVPINRCLLAVNHEVDGNPEGTADLRPLYIPWVAKRDTIIRWQLAEDTQFAGVTKLIEQDNDGHRSDSATDMDQRTLEEAVQHLVNGTLAHITVPVGWSIEQQHPEFNINSRTPELEWCNDQIFVGTNSIAFGLSNSHAASASLADMADDLFRSNIEGAIDAVLSVVQGVPGKPYTGLIKRVCDWNYQPGAIRRYPQIVRTGSYPNLKAFSSAMRELVQYRVITMTPKDEKVARRIAQLPDYPEEEIAAFREKAKEDRETEISQNGTQVDPEQSNG